MNSIFRALLTGMGVVCLIPWGTSGFGHRVDAAPLSAKLYTVQPSNKLWGISRFYKTTNGAVRALNGFQSNTISVDEHLKLRERIRRLRARVVSVPSRLTPHISGVPSQLIPVYKAAARPYHVPWTVLAAIHKTETDFATANCPTSRDGAKGPFQFMPSTFREYAVNLPGRHGIPSIQNVADAAATAAHMLARDGFSKNPAGAIYDYNHSRAYVHRILTLAGVK